MIVWGNKYCVKLNMSLFVPKFHYMAGNLPPFGNFSSSHFCCIWFYDFFIDFRVWGWMIEWIMNARLGSRNALELLCNSGRRHLVEGATNEKILTALKKIFRHEIPYEHTSLLYQNCPGETQLFAYEIAHLCIFIHVCLCIFHKHL